MGIVVVVIAVGLLGNCQEKVKKTKDTDIQRLMMLFRKIHARDTSLLHYNLANRVFMYWI